MKRLALSMILACASFSYADALGPLQIYDKTTALVTEKFYDQTFRGLPWAQLVKQYRNKINNSSSDHDVETDISGLLGLLHASHTEFVSQDDQEYWALESIFSGDIDGAPFSQIGAWFENVNGRWFARNAFDHSTAWQSGLLPGDEVVSVNGSQLKPVVSFSNTSSGNVARLTIRRAENGATTDLNVPVVNESVQRALLTATTSSWRIVNVNGKRIGYFHLWSGTHGDFKDALAKTARLAAQTTDALILDLRDGFGGASPDFLDPFFNHDSDGNSITQVYTKPMVALINDGVRSGKEWLAYIFKASHRATLVGTRTKGYFLGGGYFKVVPNRFSLYLAVQTAADAPNLEGNGVDPDVEVSQLLPYSAGKDPVLKAAESLLSNAK